VNVRIYVSDFRLRQYGHEKRFIFYRRLLPLLEFGREREVLTHHSLRNQGQRQVPLGGGETPKLSPLTESGGGSVQERERPSSPRSLPESTICLKAN
jgi:type I restriction enzyme R subunit